MRFAVVVSAPDRDGYLASVRRAETLGYDVVLCSDHLELAGRHSSHFMPIPALTAAAIATDRIRVGTAVLNQDLRHPAVLARDAASLDVLSGGRLELGLGAGWAEPEYPMAGISFDPIGIRARRFAEYVTVVKGVIAEPAFSFAGEFSTINAMPGEPAPVQAPCPPILIGATGPKLLSLAAREADIVSINLLKASVPSASALQERIEWVRDAAGARFGALELQLPLAAVLPTDRRLEDAIQQQIDAGDHFLSMLVGRADLETVARSPLLLAGPPGELADRLGELEHAFGISAVMVPMAQMEALGAVIADL
jgi:probable F420-dependent oxidoreductase